MYLEVEVQVQYLEVHSAISLDLQYTTGTWYVALAQK
eukprot:COSAG04_NODE_3234_length_3020_cov_2.736392_3_plen_37_part_00